MAVKKKDRAITWRNSSALALGGLSSIANTAAYSKALDDKKRYGKMFSQEANHEINLLIKKKRDLALLSGALALGGLGSMAYRKARIGLSKNNK